jgi:uncharacterized protein YceH (UPF0502 family)
MFPDMTSADIASANAYDALRKNKSLEARIVELERDVAALTQRLIRLETKSDWKPVVGPVIAQ